MHGLSLVGMTARVLFDTLDDHSALVVIRHVDHASHSLVLELRPNMQINSQTCRFAVARLRSNCDDIERLLAFEPLLFGVIFVPVARYSPGFPFDVSWWRGGAAEIATLVLSPEHRS